MTTPTPNTPSATVHPIVPREKLQFNLDDAGIPKYWMPFKAVSGMRSR